ncbi:MAG: DUF411 domain-containing protein [Alphaproteobacteria bacterium]|nr:DUF411 domain-containing protein [Alphaproteobacteria bacterium]
MEFLDDRLSSRRRTLRLIGTGMFAGLAALGARPLMVGAATLPPVTIYKDPNCGCCGIWTTYLRERGFKVKVVMTGDMDPVKRKARVPYDLQTCHTAFMGDYVVEGHVPLPAITRLLDERPKVLGIAVPGMPAGSPGMPSVDPEPYEVFTFAANGSQSVYMSF